MWTRTDSEFLHHRGHHSIYAGPYGGDIGRTASSFTTQGTTLSCGLVEFVGLVACGHVDLWTFGLVDLWTWGTCSLVGLVDLLIADLRTCGTFSLLDLWTSGTCEIVGLVDLCICGTCGQCGTFGLVDFVDLWDLFTCGHVDLLTCGTCGLVICGLGRTASSFTTEGTTLSMQDRTVATSDGLRVPSPQRAPLYLRRTVRWRHRTDCEFLHHRGHHSIYAGPYGGDSYVLRV